jgi:membrane protein implicated in regulation of membrane protease activity
MDWLHDNAWAVWVGAALMLGVAELASLDLALLMLAAGCLVGAGVALAGGPVLVQSLLAVAAAVAMLALVRPSVVRRLHSGPSLRTGTAALVGRQGFALSAVDVHGGQVKVGGEVWTAQPYFDHVVIPPGARVHVIEIRGATAYVDEVAELDGRADAGRKRWP